MLKHRKIVYRRQPKGRTGRELGHEHMFVYHRSVDKRRQEVSGCRPSASGAMSGLGEVIPGRAGRRGRKHEPRVTAGETGSPRYRDADKRSAGPLRPSPGRG